MFQQFDKVKYVGHLPSCTFCEGLPLAEAWRKRVGKSAIFLGADDKNGDMARVHFDGEETPVRTYIAHLDNC